MDTKKSIRNVLLALLLVISIGGIYAYWAGEVKKPEAVKQSLQVAVGEGEEVKTSLNISEVLASSGKKLVPAGKAAVSKGGTSTNVESFEASYTVRWEEIEKDIITVNDQVKSNLKVTANSSNDLLKVAVNPESSEITADGDGVEVKVKVTLDEPTSKAQYDEIAGSSLSVDLNFSIAD